MEKLNVDENLLYPLKALKKYRISDVKSYEPVLCLNPLEHSESDTRFVGMTEAVKEGNVPPPAQQSVGESVEDSLRSENAKLKELSGHRSGTC